MAFIEKRFPTKIFAGTEAAVGWNTDVIELQSGHEQRIANWTKELRHYDVTKAIQSEIEYQEVLHFFMTIGKGKTNGFRFRDLADYLVPDSYNTANVILGTGDGIEDEYQLIKQYNFGGTTYDRTITKPVTGTTKIYIDAVEKAAADATYGWSVNTITGLITFAHPENLTSKVITASFEFDVPVRFEQDRLTSSWVTYKTFRSKISLMEIRL